MKRFRKLLLFLGLLVGLAFIIYPLASQLYYDQEANFQVQDFQDSLQAIDPPELKQQNVQLAEAYNEALDPNLTWSDPYSEAERTEGVQVYARMLEVQEKIGVITVPKINVKLPLFAGTRESILQNGVGHLEGTSLPVGGTNTHSVITAHRGLPDARLFTDLDKMEIGDVFFVETMAGELYYEVDEIIVVEPHETDKVMIVAGEDYLTLLTCTPYMINSHRLLVRGKRISTPPKEEVVAIRKETAKDFMYYLKTYWFYFVTIIGTLIIVLGILWAHRRGNK